MQTCSSTDKLQIYDPVFILRFSIHCLSRNYIEPVEFASLGLLAVTFASLSSPDEDMRKLGYEALAKFKSALEVAMLYSVFKLNGHTTYDGNLSLLVQLKEMTINSFYNLLIEDWKTYFCGITPNTFISP